MFFNDGVVSEICFHLSVEKVYVTELSTSLVLLQAVLLHNEITMLLMSFSQWCSLLIMLEIPFLLRADDRNRTRFNIRQKLDDNYVELQKIYTRVEEFAGLYAPDEKRLEGLEVMTDYLNIECDETFIQRDDGKACLDAIISVAKDMPDFDVNNLSCDDDYPNCSWFHGNETKQKIEAFREVLLNGVGRCNYSISKDGERQSFKVSCVKEQNAQSSTGSHEVSINDGNTEDCPPDALFWQGLEDWSSNLTSMLKRLKAESHDELEQTCRNHITLVKERKKRKRIQSKERKKKKRQKFRERKERRKERKKQKRRRKKEKRRRKKEKLKEKRKAK